MIELHRLNNTKFLLNPEHIETIESLPDTVITLTNEHKYIVRESSEQIRELIQNHRKKIFQANSEGPVDI